MSNAHTAELASALPYGELRLLEVAIALAAKPSLLLLDEPVSGMNPTYVLEQGRMTLAGTGAELLNNPEVKAAYLGA